MNMKKTFLIIITVILYGVFFASCSANRGFVSTVTRDDIQQLAQFEMYAHFGRVENGVSIIDNDSVTNTAKSLFETELAHDKTLPVTETIAISDNLVRNIVQDEIRWMRIYIDNNVPVKDITIPPTIDSILCSRNVRFGLLVHNGGFYCPDGIYKSPGSGIPIPFAHEGSTRSAIIIVDSKFKNLVYVATSNLKSNPLEAETYRKQIKDLLKEYRK